MGSRAVPVFTRISVGRDVGHINHSLFWKNLAPSGKENKGHGGVIKDGPLKSAILGKWGSVDVFIKEFNTATAGIQGSGWGWLVCFLSFYVFVSFCFRFLGWDLLISRLRFE